MDMSKMGAGGSGAGNGNGGENGGDAENPFKNPVPEGAARTVSQVLGEIVWLMSQSNLHKSFFISDLEWFVMTPVILQQFRMFYDKDKPIGVVLWASVDAEVSARLAEGGGKMRPQDWKSGNELWAVEVIAPFGGAEAMLKDLKDKVFPGREIKADVVRDGKKTVVTV
jgi:cytolysin-activating lysine-acyltransferase